jgi:DNA polymerase (family 10)
MDNKTVAAQFSLLSKVMDLHGENSYKARSYANAAFQIEKLSLPLTGMAETDIFRIRGVGEAIGRKILDLLHTGHFPLLAQYLEQTPPGVLEMLDIKGLGAKKIAVIWKELGVENIGELLYACNENRLMLYKGFGAKTQENVRRSIEFLMASKGFFLYQALEDHAASIAGYWKTALDPEARISLTGDVRRRCNTLQAVSLLIDRPVELVAAHLPPDTEVISVQETTVTLKDNSGIRTEIFCCAPEDFSWEFFQTTGSESFVHEFLERYPGIRNQRADSEEDIFTAAGIPFIEACHREILPPDAKLKALMMTEPVRLIQPADISGVIHAHSTWSDGRDTLEEMAAAARDMGYAYLVISDHSRSAAYAGGLRVEQIAAQHAQIDELNKKLSPFRIFKSIESDILSDGSLDYPDEVLNTFELVIASVHSNLKMDQEKAMQRLLRAIENPFTTILGHPTGRLLLTRPGYPLDHQKIIDACYQHHVVIEINAHPRRLDLDWSWIPYALERGVLLSIDPDAHSIEGIKNLRYGVLSAQKGGLTAPHNLSSFSLEAFEHFLQTRRE